MSATNTVYITQYRAGKGRIPDGSCEVSTEAYLKYQKALELGLRVTAEMLSSGHIALCLEEPSLGDYLMKLCTNGPGSNSPPANLEKMLLEFDEADLEKWKKEVS